MFAIAKKIQWTWPDAYEERRFVILMGGLHIEIAILSVLGDWLEGSGWAWLMASVNVTTEGRTAGVEKGSHTSRGQWVHQVIAVALSILLQKSYDEYQASTPDEDQLNFDEWCKEMSMNHPQFDYWQKAQQLEILFLQFLRSLREGQYPRYVESLGKLIYWM